MKKDKIDMLIKNWAKTQQLRILHKTENMGKFYVRLKYKGDEFYGGLQVTANHILIKPDDHEREGILFDENRLDGCLEIEPKGIQLNPRNHISCQLFFPTILQRDRALILIRTLINAQRSDLNEEED